MSTTPASDWHEFRRPRWAWVVERILVPYAVGALGSQGWAALWSILGPLLPAVSLLVSLVLALLRLRRLSARAEGASLLGWLRGECAALGGATLGAVAYLVAILPGRQEAQWARLVALAAGLAAMLIITLSDYHLREDDAEPYLPLLSFWLTPIKLGLLGDWLTVSLQAHFAVADQRLLSVVILAVVASLLAFRQWSATAGRKGGEAYRTLQSSGGKLTLLTNAGVWGGHMLPGILLGLTIAAGWVYPALLAWLLLLLGDGLRWYLLS